MTNKELSELIGGIILIVYVLCIFKVWWNQRRERNKK